MTSFRIEEVKFTAAQLAAWAPLEPRYRNWPVVYTLDGAGKIYVEESLNVAARFRQHLSQGRCNRGSRWNRCLTNRNSSNRCSTNQNSNGSQKADEGRGSGEVERSARSVGR